jgi:hypothetical protein
MRVLSTKGSAFAWMGKNECGSGELNKEAISHTPEAQPAVGDCQIPTSHGISSAHDGLAPHTCRHIIIGQCGRANELAIGVLVAIGRPSTWLACCHDALVCTNLHSCVVAGCFDPQTPDHSLIAEFVQKILFTAQLSGHLNRNAGCTIAMNGWGVRGALEGALVYHFLKYALSSPCGFAELRVSSSLCFSVLFNRCDCVHTHCFIWAPSEGRRFGYHSIYTRALLST